MTIEELKQHCIKTIKMNEPVGMPYIEATTNRSLQEHRMVLKLIEAWDKVQDEIKQKSDLIKRLWDDPDEYPDECPDEWYAGKCNAYGEVLRIIDKHLKEVENESTDNG